MTKMLPSNVYILPDPADMLSKNLQLLQIMNLVILHQSQKNFLNVKINSIVFKEYLYTTKYTLYKYDSLPFESSQILSTKMPVKNIYLCRSSQNIGICSPIMVEGYKEIALKEKAINKIVSSYKKRKFSRKLLLLQMKDHIREIILAQALVRGYLERKIWSPELNKMKRYQENKRVAMTKIRDGLDDEFDDDLHELNDFFEDNQANNQYMTKKIDLPEDEEMKKMLEMIDKKTKPALPPLKNKPPLVNLNSAVTYSGGFPGDMNPSHTMKSTSSKASDLSRKRLQEHGELIMRGAPNAAMFHNPGIRRESSPTSVSNAITEVDVNSEKHMNNFNYNSKPAMNNLMNSSRASITRSQIGSNKPSINEQKKDYVDSWNFQDEKSKKLMEARYLNMRRRKLKKKKLTADDRLKQFRKISRKTVH